MMKPEFSTSSDRPGRVEQRCLFCGKPAPCPAHSDLGHPAYSNVRVVDRSTGFSRESGRETPAAAPKAGGSSLTGRGGTGWRTWSRIVSFGSVCLELRLDRYVSRYSGRRSLNGTACFRTSGSSRSFTVEVDTIGTAAPTPAERSV